MNIPWKTFLAIAAAAIGCEFEHGELGTPVSGGENNAYECDCQCAPPPVTRTFVVRASTDDAEQYIGSGIVQLASTDLELTDEDGFVNSRQIVGIRYPSMGIPKGSTILSAHLQFTVDEATSTATTLKLAAEASDNAPGFTNAPFGLSSRARTSASVQWIPAPWPTLDVSGPAQQSPDLTPVLQELVNRPGWNPDSSAAFLITGAGWRVAWSYDRSPANAPKLIVQYQESGVAVSLSACVPPALDPNLDGGTAPTSGDLASDCSGRVQHTVSGLASACGYPSVCTCTAGTAQKYADSCDTPCTEVPITSGCTNFDPTSGNVVATNADGGVPVCVTHSPLASALFGQRSRCEVTGNARIEVEDEDPKVTPASGVIDFIGAPCPGQSCTVGMAYELNLDSITYSHLFGSATFSELQSVGASSGGSGVTLDAAGNGSFAPSTLALAARGERDDEFAKVVDTNSNPLDVGVVWSGTPACEVAGALVGNANPELKRCEPAGPTANAICIQDADCTDDDGCTDGVCNCLDVPDTTLSMSLHVAGALVNQPPKADAGPDLTVECNRAGGADFDLASYASDPDGNLALTRWYLGSRTGTEVGVSPNPSLFQPVNTNIAYVLRVIDAFAQADEDTTHVQVVDTTAPVISCHAPASIRPGQHGLSFTATAEDVCDPSAAAIVTGFRCEKNGTVQPCKATFSGSTFTIINPSGNGTTITWKVQATDANGNTAITKCSVDVHP